ncbi:MAG: hypothetical protein N2116_05830 [Armatimonadetes bacterium]|nr:hypothetical protein [Armatimonadota bacterium]
MPSFGGREKLLPNGFGAWFVLHRPLAEAGSTKTKLRKTLKRGAKANYDWLFRDAIQSLRCKPADSKIFSDEATSK